MKTLHEDCMFVAVTLSPSSFLDTLEPKCVHTSDLKLATASAISQTLSLGSPSTFPASSTSALPLRLYKRAKHNKARMGWW